MKTKEEKRIAKLEYLKKYRARPENKARHRSATRKWAKANPKKVRAYKKAWKLSNPDKIKLHNLKRGKKRYPFYQQEWLKARRLKCLIHYSDGKLLCACCGESHVEFLALDHINNDGAKHRKEIGQHIYSWVIKNNYPTGVLQVLCHNCNLAKAIYKTCPHAVILPSKK